MKYYWMTSKGLCMADETGKLLWLDDKEVNPAEYPALFKKGEYIFWGTNEPIKGLYMNKKTPQEHNDEKLLETKKEWLKSKAQIAKNTEEDLVNQLLKKGVGTMQDTSTAVTPLKGSGKTSKAQLAHNLHQAIMVVKQGFQETKAGILKAGKALCQIKTYKWWKVSGSPAKSFAHWCENELGISKTTAYAHVSAYEKVGDILEGNAAFQDIEMSKVFLLLPHITDDMTVSQKEELLHMAMTTTWEGLCNNLKEKKGKITTDTCNHSDIELVERCRSCGKWLK